MICEPCREAGRLNRAGDGFEADVQHSFCDNDMLHPQSTPTWCDCGHVVTAEFDEPSGCRNCDGMQCMDCRCRVIHDECVDDCPDCCVADWEKELIEREYG